MNTSFTPDLPRTSLESKLLARVFCFSIGKEELERDNQVSYEGGGGKFGNYCLSENEELHNINPRRSKFASGYHNSHAINV